VFDSIEDPTWDGGQTDVPLMVASASQPAAQENHQPRKRN
jgi:hypothetical protein